jgi:hypothetical protein
MSQLDRIESKLDSALSQFGFVVKESEIANALYDEHGISYETSKHGGVKLKAVEELKAEWINKGGQYETVARSMSEWFCFLRPDTPLSQDMKNQIYSNQVAGWAIGWTGNEVYVHTYYKLLGTWEHAITKERVFKRPGTYFDKDYKNWRKAQRTQDGIIDNHYSVTYGNLSSPDNENFYSDFVKKIPDAILKIMDGKIEALEFPTNRMRP